LFLKEIYSAFSLILPLHRIYLIILVSRYSTLNSQKMSL